MILLWAVLTLIPWCKQKINADVRLIVAALASLMVGISKELMDGFYDQWPWCSDDCYFDFWDLFVWIDGLLAGSVIVIIVIILQARYAPTPEIPCDDTEISMSVDEGSEINTDNDNCSSSIEKMHSLIGEEVLTMVEANSTSDPSNSDTVDPSFSTDDSPDIGEMPSNEINDFRSHRGCCGLAAGPWVTDKTRRCGEMGECTHRTDSSGLKHCHRGHLNYHSW